MIDERQRFFIERSCREYAKLDDASIETILDVVKMLKLFSQISNYEVFIDIKVVDDDLMFVIAEQLSEESYYEYSYLGDFIYRENEPAVFSSYETASVQESLGTSLNKKNGGKIITNQRAMPILHDEEVVAILILEKSIDVNDGSALPSLVRSSKISEIMLALIETKVDNIDIQIHEGVMFFNHEGSLLYANKYAEDLYRGFGYVSIFDRHFDALNLSSRPFTELLDAIALGSDESLEMQAGSDAVEDAGVIFFQEQTVLVASRYFLIRFAVLAQLESYLVMFIDDVTQAKRFESGEGSYLVTNREMQHRIKNNLMTVVSLLRLQARQCDNDEARDIIEIAVNRILSISTTFELLAQGDSASVPVLKVLRSIRDNHLVLLENTGLELEIEVSGEDFLLDSDKSSKLGLVVNELLQNSIKHAFVGRSSGRIDITTASDGKAKVIQVRDDGVGFDSSEEKDGTFGLTIIKGLVQTDFGGKMTIESGSKGTTVSLAFWL